MGEPYAEVANAADPQQVKRAGRHERAAEFRERDALRAVLSTAPGRVVIWALLERAGIFRSIWAPDLSIHYKAGRQDFGHELLAWILETDEDRYLLMEREAREWAAKGRRAAEAARTASSQDEPR